jgi:hypothetical protein
MVARHARRRIVVSDQNPLVVGNTTTSTAPTHAIDADTCRRCGEVPDFDDPRDIIEFLIVRVCPGCLEADR